MYYTQVGLRQSEMTLDSCALSSLAIVAGVAIAVAEVTLVNSLGFVCGAAFLSVGSLVCRCFLECFFSNLEVLLQSVSSHWVISCKIFP